MENQSYRDAGAHHTNRRHFDNLDSMEQSKVFAQQGSQGNN